jgi:L-fuconolactonase
LSLADCHIHFFRRGYRHSGLPSLFGSGELAAYEAIRRAHEIELALVVGYEADDIDPDNNAYIRELSVGRPWMHTVAYVDPRSVSDAATIAGLLDRGHRGLAIYLPDDDRTQALLGWPHTTWDLLQERKAILSLNARPEAIERLQPRVAEIVETAFLFSHLGLPGVLAADIEPDALQHRLAPLLSMADLPNALAKISGFYGTSDPPHAYPHDGGARAVRCIIDAFGSARCLWGSDFAPALDFVSFPQTIYWPGIDDLPDAARDAIMRGNLARLLQKDERSKPPS